MSEDQPDEDREDCCCGTASRDDATFGAALLSGVCEKLFGIPLCCSRSMDMEQSSAEILCRHLSSVCDCCAHLVSSLAAVP